ncbi:hypothetical protein [Chenggangzhangella methanolivorans]|uniref:Uncharacterized protein n=2 Tax=Chenggangzhangella methanolivorans TaxID=1437009 RepID=A0A9E6R772_9HYPH|nr:hypothetical protein [Chenggangzhangella methanolivorans]QZN99248.1 hypothetical protein K6K41_20970 [Chenggangzhangella methanolivorans]
MTMRETERKAERATAEATRDRVESARARATELGHLADISELRSQVAALESEGAKARDERDRQGADAASAHSALEEARAAALQAAKDLQAARQDASASRAATEQARIEAAEREAEIAALRAKLVMLGADRRAPSASASPRMPHVDQTLESAETADRPDAEALAALRRRLDEVADQIAAATKAPAEPAPQSEPTVPPTKPEQRRFVPQLAAGQTVGG